MSSSVDSRAAAGTEAHRNAIIVRGEIVRPTYVAPSKHLPRACLPHVSQRCGFSPVCVRMCLVRLPACEKALPPVSQ